MRVEPTQLERKIFMNNNFNLMKINEVGKFSTLDYIQNDNVFEVMDLRLALEENPRPISEVINVVIYIKDVEFSLVKAKNSDGEEYEAIRTVVLATKVENDESILFATNSKIFAEKMASILNIIGCPRNLPEDRKFKFKVTQLELANAKRSYSIVPVR